MHGSHPMIVAQPRRGPPLMTAGRSVPREHGFWVMLVVVLVSALTRAHPTALTWGVALTLAGAAVVLGARLGARLRKRPWLQVLASLMLAALSYPVLLSADTSLSQSHSFVSALAVVFVASAFAVQAILERAKKHPDRARLATVLSISLPAFASALGLALAWPGAIPVLFSALYGIVLAVARPGAKRLKRVGWSVALMQLASGVLLALSLKGGLS